MAKIEHDELLIDEPESQAFDADDEPEFNPTPSKDDNVVVVEPKIINVGRNRRRNDMRKMSRESSDT